MPPPPMRWRRSASGWNTNRPETLTLSTPARGRGRRATQEIPMTVSSSRLLLAIVVGAALLSSSGCVWLRTKFANTAVYEDAQQVDPLEVPPDLDVPDTSAGVAI